MWLVTGAAFPVTSHIAACLKKVPETIAKAWRRQGLVRNTFERHRLTDSDWAALPIEGDSAHSRFLDLRSSARPQAGIGICCDEDDSSWVCVGQWTYSV